MAPLLTGKISPESLRVGVDHKRRKCRAHQLFQLARPDKRVIELLAILDILLVLVFVVRGLDVRLLLFLGAVPLFLAVGKPAFFIATLAQEMANPKTIVPICSAMGFAYVLGLTECDRHLVLLLVRPLQRLRPLLIPGGIAAGYLINTTIVSQAATAAVLGPVLIPLLRAGGMGAAAAGATLLIGSSMGGELFNPGAVEIAKLSELTALSTAQVVARSRRPESLELWRDPHGLLALARSARACAD